MPPGAAVDMVMSATLIPITIPMVICAACAVFA
jgi:hypothetical protein